ncbi:hypothetical protein C8N47_1156 [Mangrovibacterium marinum]|uniref:Uncharacterized protein n=1 Tax=Mangrovibacterium marinum TaxID=1639118 RepID=A0A2T5BZ79_9BACT|nr:hypothetical protein [Mangrovibacterium marinum]PTN07567.1 hypothetical protein C8N47_1156 [Mangrovibacterium marinum]
MWKQLAALLVISSIAWHILAEAAVYISFKINQDYIETYLCINRDKPESDCHGCCQLKKELEKQQETKSEMPDIQLKKIEIQYFQSSSDSSKLFPTVWEDHPQPYPYAHASTPLKAIFHPPRIALL